MKRRRELPNTRRPLVRQHALAKAGFIFKTPHECQEAFQKRLAQTGHGPGFRMDEVQEQCRLCMLWKYMDQRCNLFRRRVSGGSTNE